MPDKAENSAAYREMYFELFNGISDIIEQLQRLQQLAEERYISAICDETASETA